MAAPTFRFEVILPDRVEPGRMLAGLEVPAADGRLTVLAGHQPLICALETGMCVLRDGSGIAEQWHCSDGVLEVGSGGLVTLLVRRWVPVAEADGTIGSEDMGGTPVEDART